MVPPVQSDFSDDHEPGKLWASRPFLLGAAVVALLVLATVFVIWSTRDGDEPEALPDPATPTSTSPSASPSPSPAPTGDSVCGLEGTDDTLPTAAPAATWQLVGQIAAPVESKVGPGAVTEGGVRYCYQHSATGALLAATTTLAQAQDPSLIVEVTQRLLTGDPDVLATAERDAEDVAAGGTARSSFQFEGFNYINYTDDVATIELIARDNQSALAAVMTLRWVDGDWKVAIDAQGQIFASARRDDSIPATPWAP